MKAMILAAGLGTRFKPWTDRHPKALAVINGKTLLQRNIEWLQRAGIYEVIVNVHHFADQIVTLLNTSGGWGSQVEVSDEREAVLETGGGLKKAAPYLLNTPDGKPGGDAFVLMNVDILTDMNLVDMIAQHRQNKPLATVATTTRKTSRYLLFDENNALCGWQNVTTGELRTARETSFSTARAFSGIHVIDPAIFSMILQEGKFSMIDVYLSLAGTAVIQSFDHSGSLFLDVGRPEAVPLAEGIFF